MGARYRFTIADYAASLRLRVTNVFDVYAFDLRGSGAYDAIPGRVASLALAVDY